MHDKGAMGMDDVTAGGRLADRRSFIIDSRFYVGCGFRVDGFLGPAASAGCRVGALEIFRVTGVRFFNTRGG